MTTEGHIPLPATDKFRMRYVVIFISLLLLLQIRVLMDVPGELDVWDMGQMVLSMLFLSTYFVTVIGIALWTKSWRRLISMLVAPLSVWGCLSVQMHSGFTPEYLRFLVHKREYLQNMAAYKGSDTTFYAWFWDRTWGVGITHTETLLVYDATDKITLPPQARSAAWRSSVNEFRAYDPTVLFEGVLDVTPNLPVRSSPIAISLAPHFYLVETTP